MSPEDQVRILATFNIKEHANCHKMNEWDKSEINFGLVDVGNIFYSPTWNVNFN